jgi:AcrR family transcriptional regulator
MPRRRASLATDDKGQATARRAGSAPRTRDVEKTKQRLLDAVGRLLSRDGFTALGVNAVAQEAGTDKVLIYRYFDGFAGLLDAYAQGESFWPTNAQLVGDDPAGFLALPYSERLVRLLRNYLGEMRRRPVTHAILAWEVISRNELTAKLEDVREKRGIDLLGLVGEPPPGIDVPAVFAIVSATVSYLLMRARLIRIFLGIDLHTDEGWARIEAVITLFIRKLFDERPHPP